MNKKFEEAINATPDVIGKYQRGLAALGLCPKRKCKLSVLNSGVGNLNLLDSFQTANVELRGLCVQLSDLLKQLAAKDAEVHIFIAIGIPEEKRRRSSVAKYSHSTEAPKEKYEYMGD